MKLQGWFIFENQIDEGLHNKKTLFATPFHESSGRAL